MRGKSGLNRSLKLLPFATNSSLRWRKPTVGWRRSNGPSIGLGSGPGGLKSKKQTKGPAPAGQKTGFNPRQDAQRLNASWHTLRLAVRTLVINRNGEFPFLWVDYELPGEFQRLI